MKHRRRMSQHRAALEHAEAAFEKRLAALAKLRGVAQDPRRPMDTGIRGDDIGVAGGIKLDDMLDELEKLK